MHIGTKGIGISQKLFRVFGIAVLPLAVLLIWIGKFGFASDLSAADPCTYPQSCPDQVNGAAYTTLGDGTLVNGNIYDNKCDVYINGGPQPCGGFGPGGRVSLK